MNDHTHDNDGLSPAARAALAALKAEDDLPAAARERLWARLEAADLSDMSHAPGRSPAPRRWTGAVIGLAIAAGVALALIEVGRGATRIAAGPRADAAAYDDAARARELAAKPAGVARVAAPELAAPAPVVSEAKVSEPRPVIRDERPAAARVPAPVPTDSSTLTAETALLQRAQAALAAGDPASALARLDEHAAQFEAGVLGRERDALRVTALCAAGRTQEGRAEAAEFLKEHAGSLLAERVRGACDEP